MLKKRFFGMITLIIGVLVFTFVACDNDTDNDTDKDDPPENLPVSQRWWKWEAEDSTATLDFEVDDNTGVCTITVGGTAMEDALNWKVNASYKYTAAAGKTYKYRFEAWTDAGGRQLGIQYYNDWENDVYLNTGLGITYEPTEYTITGKPIPKSGVQNIEFQCANQTGRFYVKILSITETSGQNSSEDGDGSGGNYPVFIDPPRPPTDNGNGGFNPPSSPNEEG
jgi:hypothetical protein